MDCNVSLILSDLTTGRWSSSSLWLTSLVHGEMCGETNDLASPTGVFFPWVVGSFELLRVLSLWISVSSSGSASESAGFPTLMRDATDDIVMSCGDMSPLATPSGAGALLCLGEGALEASSSPSSVLSAKSTLEGRVVREVEQANHSLR